MRGVYSYFIMRGKIEVTVTAIRPSVPNEGPDCDAWAWRVGLGIAVPLLGLLLRTHESGSVAFVFLPDRPLPMVCLLRRYFELECLGCGLSRIIVLLLHGHLHESITTHCLGWLILLLVLAQIPYGLQLRKRQRDAWRPSERTAVLFWAGTFAAFVITRLWN